jgi:cytochrome c-type biogenesis protein CcmH
MNSAAYFWAIAGFMAGVASAFVLLRLWQSGTTGMRRIGGSINGWVAASVVVFLLGAVAIYSKVGNPQLAVSENTAVATQVADHAAAQSSSSNTSAGSMAEVTARLAAKLAKGGGSDADWQLLQQSYEFLGDKEAAALAAQHKLPSNAVTNKAADVGALTASATALESKSSDDVTKYQASVTANPKDASSWRALAEAYRAERQFPQANAAFAQLVKLKAMDADAWADYADAAASEHGALANDVSRTALSNALKLNAKHPKALWLQASLFLEEKRYPETLKTWQSLRSVIADDSADAKIIDANIAEAQSLMAPAGKTASPAVVAAVHGTVNVDSALTGKVSGMTLFVFAKAADSAAPVAVYRTSVDRWPVTFTLDDSQAMLPTHKLSGYAHVQVQARLSKSGQALAQTGDWQSGVVTVPTQQGKAVSLLVNQSVTGDLTGKAGS